MIEHREQDEDFADQLRTVYRAWPMVQPTSVESIVRGARRRRARRIAALTTVASTAVAISVAVIWSADGDGSSPNGGSNVPPAASQKPSVQSPNEPVPSDQLEAVADQMYARIDSDPSVLGYGYYMLKTNPTDGSITIWRDGGSTKTDNALRQIADEHHVTLVFKPLTNMSKWDGSVRSDTMSAVADRLAARVNDDPTYEYNTLKLEIPLNTIIVWRASPSQTTDAALKAIAREAGIDLELRLATYSREHIEALGDRLASQNGQWQEYGFTVNGAYARPVGAIVVIQGDSRAAHKHLPSTPEILGIELDGGVLL